MWIICPADDSHEMSRLIFLWKKNINSVLCSTCDWCFKGLVPWFVILQGSWFEVREDFERVHWPHFICEWCSFYTRWTPCDQVNILGDRARRGRSIAGQKEERGEELVGVLLANSLNSFRICSGPCLCVKDVGSFLNWTRYKINGMQGSEERCGIILELD